MFFFPYSDCQANDAAVFVEIIIILFIFCCFIHHIRLQQKSASNANISGDPTVQNIWADPRLADIMAAIEALVFVSLEQAPAVLLTYLGLTDLSAYKPTSGCAQVKLSSGNAVQILNFGSSASPGCVGPQSGEDKWQFCTEMPTMTDSAPV